MRDQRGSVLLLMPAAVLVFLVLGAICVDFGGVYAAQRQLSAAAEGAANDVATRALDLELLYATGEVRLVPARARVVAMRSVAAKGLDRLDPVVERVAVGGGRVTVTVAGQARYLFAGAVPGGPDGLVLRATAVVTAEESLRG